ncbi:aminotransferase class I/II-fold pyridoxal phosphate-dependent enzyme [Pseudarthrobacter sp. efr-133-R2A-89]|uniref:aminotransferase class I/II-fold pyridoxal phosphate-dependent enzyme n=1 Tax=Pseudarthrobacter sp. efr-133-R2A-89 TaxID=3040302 RepID=UPI00106554EC|nr:aminotransferase class I/II-fold pyridoxal phosphate-dependent enzyme [Pseudarthrobacter sp. efr-133-R2A-89]
MSASQSASPSVRTDRFGNPIDPMVGYARGAIIDSSIAEGRRLRHGQAVAAERVRAAGADAVAVYTGNQRDLPLRVEDLATYAEEWVGPGLFAEELRKAAIGHLGGRPDDAAAVFNRTTAGIIAVICALSAGKPVISIVPVNARSHASLPRGSRLAGVPCLESGIDGDWQDLIRTHKPALVVVTTVTSSLERLEDEGTAAAVKFAQAENAVVLLDEAYGARLRTVLHGGKPSLQLGADLSITNCDKAGLAGPRAGILVGRPPLVAAASAQASEVGAEARAPIAAGALRSLQSFDPEDLRTESISGQQISDALEALLGAVVERSDLGPMVHEDDIHAIAMQRSGREESTLVPSETASALGALLLRDHGILTVNTHGQPGARVSLRLKPTLDALRRTGGPLKVAAAVDKSLDALAAQLHDTNAISTLILGS